MKELEDAMRLPADFDARSRKCGIRIPCSSNDQLTYRSEEDHENLTGPISVELFPAKMEAIRVMMYTIIIC